MELGASLTVLTASKLGIPVSTTHCITGATVGVGLCNGTHKAINLKLLAWIFFGW
jgi:solute carrier family 20 (sodium-dependent phosphate transporter)